MACDRSALLTKCGPGFQPVILEQFPSLDGNAARCHGRAHGDAIEYVPCPTGCEVFPGSGVTRPLRGLAQTIRAHCHHARRALCSSTKCHPTVWPPVDGVAATADTVAKIASTRKQSPQTGVRRHQRRVERAIAPQQISRYLRRHYRPSATRLGPVRKQEWLRAQRSSNANRAGEHGIGPAVASDTHACSSSQSPNRIPQHVRTGP